MVNQKPEVVKIVAIGEAFPRESVTQSTSSQEVD